MIPCACRKAPAVVEKSGRSLCADCAKNYQGREYPIRAGREISCNDKEKTFLKYHYTYAALRALFFG